jgi:hypothetical protein
MKIMNFDHPKWNEFISMLGDEIGSIHGCDCTESKPNTKKVLEEIGNIDIEKTFKFLESEGGYCDCEIMLNVISPNEPKHFLSTLISGLVKEKIPFTKKDEPNNH